MNGAALESEKFPLLGSLRSERLPIANQLRDESTGNIMGIPIVTVDQSKIPQRDEQVIARSFLLFPWKKPTFVNQTSTMREREQAPWQHGRGVQLSPT